MKYIEVSKSELNLTSLKAPAEVTMESFFSTIKKTKFYLEFKLCMMSLETMHWD